MMHSYEIKNIEDPYEETVAEMMLNIAHTVMALVGVVKTVCCG
jgi:hypothetical protein